MERVRRLMRVWPYLPAFRAVAETQHLPTASEQLFVSPSALSRSIKLLEEDLGVDLFDRVGRNLELNARGRAFLSVVRDAMRLLDEGITEVTGHQLVGPVRVAAPLPWLTEVVVPALEGLRTRHPSLVPVVSALEPAGVTRALLRGRLDVALTHNVAPHEDLAVSELMAMPCSLFCGPAHTLYEVSGPTVSEDDEQAAADRPEEDPWPPHIPRKVCLRANLAVRLGLCAQGRYVTALPDVLAAPSGSLRRVGGPELRPLRLFGVIRRPLAGPGRAEIVLDVLRGALAGAQ